MIERGVRVLKANGDDLTEDPFKVALRQIAGSFAQLEKARLVGKLTAARDRKRQMTGRKVEGRKSHLECRPDAVALAKFETRFTENRPASDLADDQCRTGERRVTQCEGKIVFGVSHLIDAGLPSKQVRDLTPSLRRVERLIGVPAQQGDPSMIDWLSIPSCLENWKPYRSLRGDVRGRRSEAKGSDVFLAVPERSDGGKEGVGIPRGTIDGFLADA